MSPSAILATLRSAFDSNTLPAAHLEGLHPWIVVTPEHWLAVAGFLRDDPGLSLTMLRCITGLDYPDKKQLCAAYELLSFEHQHEICIKVFIPRDKPAASIPSVASIWRAAEWHERETYDLLGINFRDHPDSVPGEAGGAEAAAHPRRILLPDDWAGHPLRKDYPFPREYHGIPGSVEIDWAQKPNYPR